MEGLITFIAQNPSAAVIVVAIALACLFAYLLFGSFKSQVTDMKKHHDTFGDRFEFIKAAFDRELSATRAALLSHREDMGKATKAITGDLLKVSERVFELKQEMTRELLNLRALATDTGRNLELANQVSKLAIENLNEKLGRVILIEKTIETYGAQITKLQEGNGKAATDLARHHQWFASIGEALKAQKIQLEKIERDFKNKKG